MDSTFDIERVQEHEYRIRANIEDQPVESVVRLTGDTLAQLDLPDTDEVTLVRAIAQFLAQHQSVRDFPPLIDLEDLIASYDDFPGQLKQHLPSE